MIRERNGAVIAYLDDKFTPTDPQSATHVKMQLPDGRIVFVTPTKSAPRHVPRPSLQTRRSSRLR